MSTAKHKLIRSNDVHPHTGFNKWLAVVITTGVGNMWFFYALAIFIGGWMLGSKLGWIAFDPTNRRMVDGRYVRIAVGRDYSDVPPTRGTYHGGPTENLSVAVTARVLD
jgi:hypothetical protein